MESMEDRMSRATRIIRNHIVFAMGGSLIPVPIADTIAITGVQLDMIYQLSQLYNVNYRASYGKTVLVSLVGNGLGQAWASLLKAIPVVGPVLGGVSMAFFGGALTLAIGEVYLMHLEKGGTPADFHWKRYQQYFRERFIDGTYQQSRLPMEDSEAAPTALDEDLVRIRKLKELNALREKGAISQEEFERMKRDILGD